MQFLKRLFGREKQECVLPRPVVVNIPIPKIKPVKIIRPHVFFNKTNGLWCCDYPPYRPYYCQGFSFAVVGHGKTPSEAYENWRKRYLNEEQ